MLDAGYWILDSVSCLLSPVSCLLPAHMAKRKSKKKSFKPEARAAVIEPPPPTARPDSTPEVAPRAAESEQPLTLSPRSKELLLCALLFSVVFCVFLPATRNEFVNYDDYLYVTDNPQVTSGLTWAGVGWALGSTEAANWHPLTWLSHMLDYQLFGLHAWGHHLTSILFHALNAVLVLLVLRTLTGATWRSFLVAALFGLHPLRVESVAWVAERKDVLSAFFGLLAIWAYAAYARKSPVSSLQSPVSLKSQVSSLQPGTSAGDRKQEPGHRPAQSGSHELEGLETGDRRLETGAIIQHPASSTPNDAPHSTLYARRLIPSPSLWYALALLCFALGLMSKPMLVSLPFVLLLLDYWPLQRFRLRSDAPTEEFKVQGSRFKVQGSGESAGSGAGNAECGPAGTALDPFKFKIKNLKLNISPALPLLREKLPFLALAAISCVITLLAQRGGGAMESLQVPLLARLGNALVSYCRYLGKLVWPVHLSPFYPHPGSWPIGTVLLAAVLLGAIFVAVVAQRRSRPWLLAGWLWFVVTLLPVIGLVQVGQQAMADRYSYLPLLGVLLALAWGLGELSAKWPDRAPTISAAVTAAVLTCAVLTRHQIAYWKDSETLFRYVLAVTRNNYVAHSYLGNVLEQQGRRADAMTEFEKAIAIRPNIAEPHNSLGSALLSQGRVDEALGQFQEALRWRPHYARAHNNLGIALGRKGRLVEAIGQFQEALRLNPKDAKAHNNLGLAFQAQGRLDDAIAQLQEAVRLTPKDPEARNNLGMALGRQGRLDEAITQLQAALRLRPNDPQALHNLGMALARQGHLDEAIHYFEESLRFRPDSPETQARLGLALARKGCREEAIAHLLQALKLQPDYPPAEQELRALTGQ